MTGTARLAIAWWGAGKAILRLLALSPALSAPAVAAAGTEAVPPSYVEVVEQYGNGDRKRAMQEVIAWHADVLARLTAQVAKARSSGARADIQMAAIRGRLPAAVMLHTQAGLYLSWREDGAGAWRQWLAAQALAELPTFAAEQAAFLRAWYHAFGLFFLGSYNLDQSIEVLDRGRRRFPDDVPLALAAGQAYEARGASRAGQVHGRTGSADVVTPDLDAAERIYRDLLALDPSLGEARLRLGSVVEMTGQPELALTLFRQTAATTPDGRLRYLSHLFAGNLLRHRSRMREAEQEFRLALRAWPAGQAAALSLAETLHAAGERTSAGGVLVPVIAAEGVTPAADPFRTYSFGDRAEHKRLLEMVAERAGR
jgi:tetratricopeptide (TPR) repeat protein